MRELHQPHLYTYKKNVTFLVKTGTGCLADTKDLKTDKRMDKSKIKSFYFKMKDENLDIASEDNYDYKVTRFVYIRRVNKDFHKVIILVTHREEGNVPLVYIQFYFDGKEHDLEPVPCHGNNLKKDKPRHSTNASVRDNIRKLSTQGLKGKEIFCKFRDEVGGFEGARSTNDIPSSLDQIYDISRKSKNKTDELLKILDIAASERNRPNAFVRDVHNGDDFNIFLASNQQLQNIKCFCLDGSWSILGVDPTLKICNYNVTVTTYKHPLLVAKATNQHPVMIGTSLYILVKHLNPIFRCQVTWCI